MSTKTSQTLTRVQITKEIAHINPHNGKTIYLDLVTNHQVTEPTLITIDTREELKEAILNRNQQHLSKTRNTPWHQEPLKHINSENNYNASYTANTGDCYSIDESSFIETKTILEIIREEQTKQHSRWQGSISFEDFIDALDHWKESTSTSPSRRDLGVYRALTTAHKDKRGEFGSQKDKQGISIQDKATSILQVIHTLLSLCIAHGFYLRRWTSVISVMIYKKAGSIALEDLRIIGLFEAEFNLAIGILFGRRAIFHQIDNKHMHQDQYGRPGVKCQDVAFAKILQYHVSKYTQTPMGNFESDAEACFDRIMMAFALLCFSIWGAPNAAIKMWEKYSLIQNTG